MKWLLTIGILELLGISSAYAEAATPAKGSAFMSLLLPFVLFIFVLYFLLIRPQSKRAKEQQKLLSDVAIGDEVLTSGGLVGKVLKLRDTFVVLKIAQNVEVTVQKNAIANVLPKGTLEIN